jgi:hypothetical protein
MEKQIEEIRVFLINKGYQVETKAPPGVWAIVNEVKTEWNTNDRNITIGFMPHKTGDSVINTSDLENLEKHLNSTVQDKPFKRFTRVIRFSNEEEILPTPDDFYKIVKEIEELPFEILYPYKEITSSTKNKRNQLKISTESICPKLKDTESSIIRSLKASPIFNLSLSSLELFHSNLLFWIANNYKNEFGKIFSMFCNTMPPDLEILDVRREEKHIDLSFKYSDNQEVFIENKVKSIPNRQQLLNYSDEHGKDKAYVLLSLSEPVFFKNNTCRLNNATWHYLSYSKLKEKLAEITRQDIDSYHRRIIEDYIVLLKGIIDISNISEPILNETYQCQFYNVNILGPLKEIRLQDIYLKKKAELLAYKIYEILLERKIEGLLDYGEQINWNSRDTQIFTGSGMTKSGGVLIDLKSKISSDYALVIQIQDGLYRLAVEVPKSKKAIKIAVDMDRKHDWFAFDPKLNFTKVYPEHGGFNMFTESFRHRQVKIHADTTIQDIIDIMIRDFDRIVNLNP